MKQNNYERYEEVLLALIEKIREDKGINQSQFGIMLLGGAGKWWKTVNVAPSAGKRRKIPIREAAKAADILGMDLSHLLWKVEQEILKQDEESTHPVLTED